MMVSIEQVQVMAYMYVIKEVGSLLAHMVTVKYLIHARVWALHLASALII